VLKAFATTVMTSSPLAIVASASMLVGWMLPKRRHLIRWKQALIPKSSWADYSSFKLEDELLVEGGSDVTHGKQYSQSESSYLRISYLSLLPSNRSFLESGVLVGTFLSLVGWLLYKAR
jgi:hypothetical protein